MNKKEVINEIRNMMCSGKLYNPITWEYYKEDGSYTFSAQRAKIMSDYQNDCRKALREYNSLENVSGAEDRRRELINEIFGLGNGVRIIEAPLHANYGGKHTVLKGAVYFNFNVTLIEDGEIEIGDKTMIGANVVISTAEHPKKIETRELGQGILFNKKIIIGKNVWIGSGAIILAGSKIGDNCIIGAGSIITKNTVIPNNKIAIGVISSNNVNMLKNI